MCSLEPTNVTQRPAEAPFQSTIKVYQPTIFGVMFMDSRRNFLGKMASGLAVVAAPGTVLGANERIRLGIIGIGARGNEITRWAIACPNTEFVAFADIYTKQLERAKAIPGVSPHV